MEISTSGNEIILTPTDLSENIELEAFLQSKGKIKIEKKLTPDNKAINYTISRKQ
jgi:hypothetical protein